MQLPLAEKPTSPEPHMQQAAPDLQDESWGCSAWHGRVSGIQNLSVTWHDTMRAADLTQSGLEWPGSSKTALLVHLPTC